MARDVRGLSLLRSRFLSGSLSGLGLALALLCAMPGSARATDQSDELGEMQRQLAAQQAINAQLLQRLGELEASLAAMREEMQEHAAPPHQGPVDPDDFRVLREDLALMARERDEMPSLGGYFDFEYFNDNQDSSQGTFRQHHLTLLVSKEMQRFRIFSELEWEYAAVFDGDGGTALSEARGEIKLEQGWGEYAFSELLTMRAGLILTPGHWNVREWPNLTLSTRDPLIVHQIYPQNFTGVMAYGTQYWGDFGLTHRTYLGNGESPNLGKMDDNENKAVGGRLSLHLPSWDLFQQFDLGLSGYGESPRDADRTRIWGLDTQIRMGRFELLAEFARRSAAEDRIGWYVQPSYRITERLTAFYRHDLLRVQGSDRTQEHTLGVNFHPMPEVALKLELYRSLHSLSEDFDGVAASFALLF